ncbi:MAG: VRR-NUC domain-containing protein [Flavobacteriaceae bacterium]|jgi:hypothetical protein|nr:VRR-NUC domain-containing protein [Flavobacteriaceae bacterium]
MKQLEHILQVSCVKWFGLQFPKLTSLLMAIPNGGQRNKIVGAKLKAEGVRKGCPDLFLAIAKNGFNGLFVELKYGKNKPTEHQKIMIEKLRAEGYLVEVIYDFKEFQGLIKNYLA